MQIKEDNHGKPGKPKKKIFELPPEEKAELLKKMQAGVAAGNIDDIREMGHMYQTGELGPQDDNEAFRLTKIAVDAGDDKAMVQLAPLYILGIGCEKDYEKAFALFKQANDMGNMKAPRYYGTHLELGIGTDINYQEAARGYIAAMERGDITGECQLGSLYERGLGVVQDYEKAAELYEHSSERGDIIASSSWVALGNLYETRTDGKADLKLAKEYYQKAADCGHPDGCAGLLRMGHYNPHPWIAGHNFALSILCYVSDLHADPVYERAIHLACVQEQLVQEYYKDLKKGNTENAIAVLEQSAGLGYAKALAILGQRYIDGADVSKDAAKGREMIDKALKMGYILQ